MIEREGALSVSKLNAFVAYMFKNTRQLNNITIKGEVSGLKPNRTGHAYFTLKDANAQIACFMPANVVKETPFFKNGMEVYVRGDVGLYAPYGKYTITIKQLEKTEEEKGALAKQLEDLKNKLTEEGIFDERYKKPLPVFPSKLAILSSQTASGLMDLKNQILEKNDYIDIELYPIFVQGLRAVPSITKALELVNKRGEADLIILARGGGSKEDLMPFNEEAVVRSIFQSKIPVITAIGHEDDRSLADMAADWRAITPTAAAHAIPDINEYRREMHDMLLDLRRRVENSFVLAQQRLEGLRHQLELANPLNIIDRGFGAILDSSRRQIKSVSQVSKGDRIEVLLNDGSLKAVIEEVNNKDEFIRIKSKEEDIDD